LTDSLLTCSESVVLQLHETIDLLEPLEDELTSIIHQLADCIDQAQAPDTDSLYRLRQRLISSIDSRPTRHLDQVIAIARIPSPAPDSNNPIEANWQDLFSIDSIVAHSKYPTQAPATPFTEPKSATDIVPTPFLHDKAYPAKDPPPCELQPPPIVSTLVKDQAFPAEDPPPCELQPPPSERSKTSLASTPPIAPIAPTAQRCARRPRRARVAKPSLVSRVEPTGAREIGERRGEARLVRARSERGRGRDSDGRETGEIRRGPAVRIKPHSVAHHVTRPIQ
jgi:hypothetical protein